jgi:hypothetical protein
MSAAEDRDLFDRIDELSKSLFANRPDLIEQVQISVPRIEKRSTNRTFWRKPIVTTITVEDKHVVFSGVPVSPSVKVREYRCKPPVLQIYEQFYRLQASSSGCELSIWSLIIGYDGKVQKLLDYRSFPLRTVLRELPFVFNGGLRDHPTLSPTSWLATMRDSRIENDQVETNLQFWPPFVERMLQRLAGNTQIGEEHLRIPSAGDPDGKLYGMTPLVLPLPIEG